MADQLEEGQGQQSNDSLAEPIQPKTEEQLIAEAFGQVKVFVETGQREGYLQMAPSEVRKFTLASYNDCVVEQLDEADPQDVSKWATATHLGPLINRIAPQDEQQLGKIQIDPITGERYMLVPIEVNQLNLPPRCISSSGGSSQKPVMEGRSDD